jgi:hypothetical protein
VRTERSPFLTSKNVFSPLSIGDSNSISCTYLTLSANLRFLLFLISLTLFSFPLVLFCSFQNHHILHVSSNRNLKVWPFMISSTRHLISGMIRFRNKENSEVRSPGFPWYGPSVVSAWNLVVNFLCDIHDKASSHEVCT